jgi:hypothetical protein
MENAYYSAWAPSTPERGNAAPTRYARPGGFSSFRSKQPGSGTAASPSSPRNAHGHGALVGHAFSLLMH